MDNTQIFTIIAIVVIVSALAIYLGYLINFSKESDTNRSLALILSFITAIIGTFVGHGAEGVLGHIMSFVGLLFCSLVLFSTAKYLNGKGVQKRPLDDPSDF
jgi:O-antigen ligase